MNPVEPEKIKDIIALSPLQEGMLYHYLKAPGTEAYVEQLCLNLSGELDPSRVQRAWDQVVQSNEMLRTAFRWEKLSSPVQLILKPSSVKIGFHDLSSNEDLEQFKSRDRQTGFDLRRIPLRLSLCTLPDSQLVMIITYHHILFDGWSTGIILQEFIHFYRDPGFIPPQKAAYKDFVRWILNSGESGGDTFWQEYLQGIETGSTLSIKQPSAQRAEHQAMFTFSLDDATRGLVNEFVEQSQCTEAAFFYAVWGIVLSHVNDCEDLIFGTTVSGRSAPLKGVENSVGLYINTLPLRIKIADLNARDLVTRLTAQLIQREEYTHSSLVDIKRAAGLSTGDELFDTVIIIENYPIDHLTLSGGNGLTIDQYSMTEMTHYDLNLAVTMEDAIGFTFGYNAACFRSGDIQRLSMLFLKVLALSIEQPETLIADYDLLSLEEKEQILIHFNQTDSNTPPPGTIIDIFESQAERSPQHIALKAGQTTLTYNLFSRYVNHVTLKLREQGIVPGTVVALRMYRSLEMVIHIFAILKAGAAYLPVEPVYPQERADYIMKDSNAAFMLTEPLVSVGNGHTQEFPPTESRPETAAGVNDPCYIIYTSGTTGQPKGVLIRHSSVVSQLHGLQCDYPLEKGDSYLLKTPYVFDVSVTELFGWFWQSGSLAVLDAGAEKNPKDIMGAISQFSVTHINFVPSLFNAFVESINHTGVEASRSSLETLKYIFLAGEALPAELVNRFNRLNLDIPLKNLYGPTETTIYGSAYSLDRWNGQGSVPIGKPVRNGTLFILDRNLLPRPIGLWGELYIGGLNLAEGYLNGPVLTAQRFVNYNVQNTLLTAAPNSTIEHQNLVEPDNRNQITVESSPESDARRAEYKDSLSGQRIYKTGDLARWTAEGDVEFLGRIDHQVKIRGYRIEPGEIESQLLTHPLIEEAVVVPFEKSGGYRSLCAYITAAKEITMPEFKAHLSSRLPDYMIPAHFITLNRLPLTASGKVNRRLLPLPGVGSDTSYAPPRDHIEETLVNIWAETLDVDSGLIGIDRNFFDLGGHSLNVTGMIGRIQKQLQVDLPFGRLFQTPTVRGLAEYIRQRPVFALQPLQAAELREYYPLSPAQRRLYLVHLMDPGSLAYNMSTIINLQGELDVDRLRLAFQQLVAENDSLRTSIHSFHGEPVQRIHDSLDFQWEMLPLGYTAVSNDTCPPMKLAANFIRPFDMKSPPLFRIGFINCNSHCNGLIVDMHHIIADGVSLDVMTARVVHYYNRNQLAPITLQYKDYVMWENRVMHPGNPVFDRLQNYWLSIFDNDIPRLDLPYDYERPDSQDFQGGALETIIERELSQRLKQLARRYDASLFMVLLALFNILLARLTNAGDILVGTGVEGRSHADLKNIIGMFVNTLVLRNTPSPEKTFSQFIADVKTVTTEAMEHQDYPFEKLVDQLAPDRESGRNPLFDVLFQFNSQQIPPLDMTGVTVKSILYDRGMSKFDLTLWAFDHFGEHNDRLMLRFEYARRLFTPETITVMARYYKRILEAVLDNPGASLARLSAPLQKDRKAFMDDLNQQIAEETHRMDGKFQDKTFRHVLIDSLLKHKHKLAIELAKKQITYEALDIDSNRMANGLRLQGIQPGDLVGVNLHDRANLIITAVAVLKTGAVFVPLDTAQPVARLNLMIESVNMKCVIREEPIEDDIQVQWMTPQQLLDAGTGGLSDSSLPALFRQDDPVYIYYTSGSTGTPKAILGRDSGLLHFIDWETAAFEIDSSFRFSQLSAPGFDAFLRDVFTPLCSGAAICIPPHREILMDAEQLLKWLEDSQVHFISCVPGVFRLLNANNLTTSSLSHLKVILFSGERITAGHLRPWFDRIGTRVTLVNLWGTSETTLAKTFHIISPQDLDRPRVPVGRPLPGAAVIAMDKHMQWCEPLVCGELYIRTPYRSLGYYNDDGANTERFIENPFSSVSADLIHKTGDLGRIMADGTIDLHGRADRQVKIRGIRIEPGEIESLLLAHHSVKEAAVIKKVLPGDNEILCAFIVANDRKNEKYEEPAIIQYLEQKLPSFMVPGNIISIERMPRTPNGKIDYSVLHTLQFQSTTVQDQPPQSEVEKELAQLWRDILKRDDIGLNAHFFSLGGNSLNIMRLISMIHRRFDVRIPLGTIFNNPTLQRQADIIQTAATELHDDIDPVEDKEYYPLSAAQKRLYILNQLDEDNISYNIPARIQLRGQVDIHRLEYVFRQLILRHESLRTSFHLVDGQPVQKIHPDADFSLVNLEPGAVVEVKPFNLKTAPLLHASLSSEAGDRYLLAVDMHHIITDGQSIATFIREFIDLYCQEDLPPLSTRYRDFTCWQALQRQSEAARADETYWLDLFKDEIPLLDLPCDFPRPSILEFQGNTVYSYIDEHLTQRLNAFSMTRDITLFMLLLSAYNLLLSKLSGQEDILVGIPSAGRSHASLQPLIGMFVNTLVLRSRPLGTITLDHFLSQVKEHTVTAFQHQDFQFEDLVEKLGAGKDVGRNPLFDTMFVLENMDTPEMELPGLNIKQLDYRTDVAKFDMILNCTESGGQIKFFVEYRTSLFQELTIHRFITYFKAILEQLVTFPNQSLSQYEIITAEEKRRILDEFNRSEFSVPGNKTVHEAFQEQAGATPQRIALTGFPFGCMSYGQLNALINRLAHLLRSRGAGQGTRIAVMIERSPRLVIAILAILKAGGTYLPIDPEYPQKRITQMIDESDASLVLTVNEIFSRYIWEKSHSQRILALDTEEISRELDAMPRNNPPVVNTGNDLIYIIFTSGSTGKPKGAGVYHRSFYNLVYWYIHQFKMNEEDHILLLTSLSFDLTQKNLYSTLMVGGKLGIPSINYFDPSVILEELIRLRVTIVNCTPSMIYRMVEYAGTAGLEKLAKLRLVFLGGEPLTLSMMRSWLNSGYYNARIINTYGPTECTDICAFFTVDNPQSFFQRSVPTGGPIYNAKLYVVDRYLKLQPPGIPGELLIGGAGVGIGYVNSEELTGQKFIRHSFQPDSPAMRLYYTGDLVKWLPQGLIEFLGRIDHQVKVRGFRIELGEIESHLLSHPGVKETVVAAIKQDDGDHVLCAYLVYKPGKSVETPDLKRFIASDLPAYMVPSYFVVLDTMPLNPNGKVDRKALPPPGAASESEENRVPGPMNDTQLRLLDIWRALLKIEGVGIDDNFFDIGGHSLKVLQLVNALHKEFNVKVNFQDVFLHPTIRELSSLIGSAESTGNNIIPLLPDKEYYDISYTQQRMWLLNRLNPDDPAFNLKARLSLNRAVEMDAIHAALQQLADRHDAFRTYFKSVQGTPVQVIINHLAVQPEFIDISHLTPDERDRQREHLFQQESTIPFQLDQPPLFRMKILKLSPELYDVILTMHHIITDGWSLEVLEREFPQIYHAQLEGKEPVLEPLPIRYRDYAYWHNEKLSNPQNLNAARTFWEGQLNGDAPVLDLPYDFPKHRLTEKNSVAYRTVVSDHVIIRLKKIAKHTNASLFMVLLSAFNMMLARISGQETILIGIPGAARPHEDLKNVVGLFVNTLILKNHVQPAQMFKDLLLRVQDNMMQVLEHQDYPLELICSEYKIRYPALSVFFNMSIFGNTLNRELLDLDSYHVQDVQNAKFDIVCYLEEYKNGIEIKTVYYRDLFKPETIEHIMRLYLTILENISNDTGKAVKDYYKSAKRKRLNLN